MKLRNILLLSLFFLSNISVLSHNEQIVIQTNDNAIVFTVGDNKRLYQSYFGHRLTNSDEYANLPLGKEAYLTHGMEDYFEPALHINHSDGNSSTLLEFKSYQLIPHESSTETIITLVDPAYGSEVMLHFEAFEKENVFKSWVRIVNNEKSDIELEKIASSLLHFNAKQYVLTQYSGDWANEANKIDQILHFGKKVIDTKLGTRTHMFISPFFQLSLGGVATETSGSVITATLAWSGNFRFVFEVDNSGGLRVISGINPYFSSYSISGGKTFKTPEFIFTLSNEGTGKASRNLHDWARKYQLKDGQRDRMTLLNNWESTYFDFDENKLITLIQDAKELGVDMFLLDDGWFGNRYPRGNDTQGLGDWTETVKKLPNGIGRLTEEAKKHGVKFGIWIEPEMVSRKSELYEKHKDWVIHLPNREEYYFRNQLVLDLSNPKVQDYVFNVVDELMRKYPDITYFKWDCNSPITNIYSMYEEKKQSHLYLDYVYGLYTVLDRIKAKYPNLPMMLCAGGGGRTDYQALKYFTEMWLSDNTDPVERLFIQWGYSQVFPSKVQCAHVTTWNKKASVKFRTNVAMMGKLGFDLNLHELSYDELAYCKRSVKEYNRLKSIILDGDQYRLASPYEGNHASTMFVDKQRGHALVFVFDIHPRYNERLENVLFQGLISDAKYQVHEINRMDGSVSVDSRVYSGEFLMTIGLPLFTTTGLTSRLYEVTLK